jgi:hypothetical protein
MNDVLIQEFHDECCSQNNEFDELRFKLRFRKEVILEAYEESEVFNPSVHVNGLFWSLLFGNFKMAYFMIENGYFDPTKLFCDEIHILHILATMGGRNNSLKNPQEPIWALFTDFTAESENNKFVPTCINMGLPLQPIIYKKKKLLKFASKLVKNYNINVSVLTNWKWWLIEENQFYRNINLTTQTSIWYKFYRRCISYLKENLNFSFQCSRLTPFHYACLFGKKEFVEFLVLEGCDIFCLGCKNICIDCPFNIVSFYQAKNEWELDDLLDKYFTIRYHKNDVTPDDKSIEIYKITDYIYDELVYMIMAERRMIRKYSLKMTVIENISKMILKGIYIKDFHTISKSLKRDIELFIHIYYYQPKIINKSYYYSQNKRISPL